VFAKIKLRIESLIDIERKKIEVERNSADFFKKLILNIRGIHLAQVAPMNKHIKA